MPILPIGTSIPERINPPPVNPADLWSGAWYWGLLLFMGIILFIMFIGWIIIKIWGSPILTAKSAHTGGKAIVQHFENSRIGILKLARIGGGAIRHDAIEDGTLITIPKGINNLCGLPLVNSWNLTGISLPVFLVGALTKLRQMGITTRKMLEDVLTNNPAHRYTNLILESYNFDDFSDVLKKSAEPSLIPLEIEHTNDFIKSVNQHYTESDITKEIKSFTMNNKDDFGKSIMMTGIAILITALAVYFLMGSVK